MPDVESGQRTEQFEHLDAADVGPASLEPAALEPELAARPLSAATSVQHAVDARRRPGVRDVACLHRYRVWDSWPTATKKVKGAYSSIAVPSDTRCRCRRRRRRGHRTLPAL